MPEAVSIVSVLQWHVILFLFFFPYMRGCLVPYYFPFSTPLLGLVLSQWWSPEFVDGTSICVSFLRMKFIFSVNSGAPRLHLFVLLLVVLTLAAGVMSILFQRAKWPTANSSIREQALHSILYRYGAACMLDLRMEISDVLGLRNSTTAFLCLCSAPDGAESMTMNTGEQEILHCTSCTSQFRWLGIFCKNNSGILLSERVVLLNIN
jgi:hypothetical protein